MTHAQMVTTLVKTPSEIQATLTPVAIDVMHAGIGIFSEAGEIADAVKKHVIYNKPLDIANLKEELGDLEFYMEQMRQAVGLTREECLRANMEKLAIRYPKYNYSDKHAQARADKQ